MAELKTKPTKQSIKTFIDSIEDEQKRKDCRIVLKLMRELTGEKAKMWGDSIVGFGTYHYKYKSGREGDWMLTGFSPRKQNLTIYIMPGFSKFETLLKKLGKHKTSKSCLYIKSLGDIDLDILSKIIS
ncbi:MAG: DUF1801 domain-containing protein, partial [Gammaproteobacteria bacterium]|nr:DUF1801 domain-containing protein [Gammaproteobacteria bacterium]